MKNLTLLTLIVFLLFFNFRISAQVLYSEDYSKDPNYTSLSPSTAYWDETNENYYVKTFDNLQDKYWAYSPKFTTADASKNIFIKLDMLCENADWGTYPGIHFYNSEPTDISNESRTLSVRFTWSDNNYKKISIGSTSDKGTASYGSSASFDNNKWYTVEISYYAATNKADIKVTEKASGSIFYQESNVDFYLSDFSYLALGYYNQPNYGNEWSPIRLDNVEISGSQSTNNETTENLYPIFKYQIEQSGVVGVVWGARLLSFINLVGAAYDLGVFTLDFAIEAGFAAGGELFSSGVEMKEMDGVPKNVVCCIKLDEKSGKISNQDFIFLLEDKNKVDIGEPFRATYIKSDISYENNLIPPDVGYLKTETYEELYNESNSFLDIKDANAKMGSQFIDSENFWTIGVVNGFERRSGQIFMILQTYVLNHFAYRDMSFIAVDVSDRDEFPELGSLVRIEGETVNMKESPIKRTFALNYSEVVKYVKPKNGETGIKLIRGEYVNNLIYGTSIFSIYQDDNGIIVAIDFPDETKPTPDFSFTYEGIILNPNEFVKEGKNYSLEATVQNKGNIKGNLSVIAHINIDGTIKEIGSVDIKDLEVGDKKNVTIDWLPDRDMSIFDGLTTVFFTIVNSNPLEENTSNNTKFKEVDIMPGIWGVIGNFLRITVFCPVSLEITDPNGNIITQNSNSISDAKYEVGDFDDNYSLDKRVFIPNPIQGVYDIKVIPDSDASPDSTYTLKIRASDESYTLANNVKISEIPANYYSHTITSYNTIKKDDEIKVWLKNDILNINTTGIETGEILVEIVDISGKILYSRNHESNGNSQIKIDARNLHGVNILRISNKKMNKSSLIIQPK